MNYTLETHPLGSSTAQCIVSTSVYVPFLDISLISILLYDYAHLYNADFCCTSVVLSLVAPVSFPDIRRVYSQNSSQCSVECSVKNGREVTVSWYRGNDMLNETNSSDINVHTKVTLNTEWEDNGTYYCVAFNPVSNRTTQLNISEVCVQGK